MRQDAEIQVSDQLDNLEGFRWYEKLIFRTGWAMLTWTNRQRIKRELYHHIKATNEVFFITWAKNNGVETALPFRIIKED